jgi:hypothetical protein
LFSSESIVSGDTSRNVYHTLFIFSSFVGFYSPADPFYIVTTFEPGSDFLLICSRVASPQVAAETWKLCCNVSLSVYCSRTYEILGCFMCWEISLPALEYTYSSTGQKGSREE